MKTFKQFLAEAYKLSKNDSELIFNKNDILVLKINSRAAAIKYGAGTRWCITDKDSCYHWDLYRNQSEDNQFYIIVNKKTTREDPYYRVAVYVKDENIVYPYNAVEKDEVMDKKDLIGYLSENDISVSLFKTRSGKDVSYFKNINEGKYTRDELEKKDWDELTKMAYGVKVGDIIKLKPSQIKIKYKDDTINPIAIYNCEIKKNGKCGMDWVKSVSFKEPVKVSLGIDGKSTKEVWYLEDGHHRLFAAKKLRMPYINAEVEQINLKAVEKLLKESFVLDSDDEYNEVLNRLYPKEFVDMILTSDQTAKFFSGEEPTIESTGNILVKYSHGNGYVCIMGMVSKNGHVTKSDYKDILKWGERIREALENGDTVLTSTNTFSKPILLKLIKDMDVDIEVLQTMRFPFGTWETLQIDNKG